MTPYSFETQLRDGTSVLLRQLESGDRKLIEIGMEHLSPKSRYMRFFRPVTKLSKKTLDDLTWVDGVNHIAIGALDLTHVEAYPIGVARCVRLKNQPSEAEVAITVIDSHQGRGLGTILLAAVAYAASVQGISAFVATVLSENKGMLKLFKALGASSHYDGAGVVSVRVPITGDAHRLPDTPMGAVVRRIYSLMADGEGRQDS